MESQSIGTGDCVLTQASASFRCLSWHNEPCLAGSAVEFIGQNVMESNRELRPLCQKLVLFFSIPQDTHRNFQIKATETNPLSRRHVPYIY